MLLSMPFWAVVIGQAGFNFMTVLLSTEITIYMAKILKFDLKTVSNYIIRQSLDLDF